MRSTIFSVLLFAVSTSVHAQNVIELPSLSISDSTLDARVTYDSARGIYRYEYKLNAAATNKAPVTGFRIDVSGRIARPQLDPALQNNVVRRENTKPPYQPATTIPVGIIVPGVNAFGGGVGKPGWAYFTSLEASNELAPGTTQGGFVLESKLPPGVRRAWVTPSESSWINITLASPAESEFYPESAAQFELQTTTIGPSDPDDATLFNGGGQSPANVNVFLRYANPTGSRTRLTSATATFNVNIFYAPTIDAATFKATLDGVAVTSEFHPVAGGADVVRIPLHPGTNKLQVSVQGTTTSGRVATDTDTLTFIVR